MRRLNFSCVGLSALALVAAATLGSGACGSKSPNGGGGDGGGGDGNNNKPDACSGLQCQITDCQAKNMPPTSITGTIWAPNGTLPLDEVNVYIPNTQTPLPAFPSGVQCETCSEPLPGDPIVTTTSGLTGSAGFFQLNNIPNGSDIPVVITIGKWRRQISIPSVSACTSTTLSTADTSLPKGADDMSTLTTSVDLPNIAISTGGADALECLILKLGIEDKEISTDGMPGHIHLYADTQSAGEGTSSFTSGFAGDNGGNFIDSQTLWGASTGSGDMNQYDIVIFSCEGGQFDTTKTQNAMNNVEAYADGGGRVFMSHWHNIWIEGNTQNPQSGKHQAPTSSPAEWTSLATFNDAETSLGNNTVDTIDTNADDNPKGTLFANWMFDPTVGGSTTIDDVAIEDGTGKQTATTVNGSAGTERWVNLDPTGNDFPQIFQFSTPASADSTSQCGKVVFSDMHVSGDSTSSPNEPYPSGCATSGLTPQEKALAFMFFDISTCAGTIDTVH